MNSEGRRHRAPGRRTLRSGRGRRTVALGMAAVIVTACGDGDDATPADAGASDATTTPASTTEAPATSPPGSDASTTTGVGDFCADYVDVGTLVESGTAGPDEIVPMLDRVEASAPDDVATEVGVMTRATRAVLDSGGTDFSPFETEEFGAAAGAVDAWVFDSCPFDARYEVQAVDFGFIGLPDEMAAGHLAIRLTNGGSEVHEIAVMRKADGVTADFDEILALGEEGGAEAMVEFVGQAFAARNGDAGVLYGDFEPGEYLAVCFVSTGTRLEDDGTFVEGTGDPHLVLGMRHEFTVS